VPRVSTPTTSSGDKQEHDATYNRRPARYDPKELFLDVTERREADMEWGESTAMTSIQKSTPKMTKVIQDISYEYLTGVVDSSGTSR